MLLSNIDIIKYFICKPRSNSVFSSDILPKDGAFVINLDDKQNKETNWVSLFIDINRAVYFDSFGIEYIALEVLNKIKDKSMIHNIFRIQSVGPIMCGFYYIAFI